MLSFKPIEFENCHFLMLPFRKCTGLIWNLSNFNYPLIYNFSILIIFKELNLNQEICMVLKVLNYKILIESYNVQLLMTNSLIG